MRRKRRRSDPRRQTLAAALVGGLVLATLAYASLTAGNGVPLMSYYYLNARFRDAAELDPYSDVRIAGKLVGQVLSSSFADHTAVVKLQLDPSLGRLRTDTTARIRLRGLIGAKFVELTPGTRGAPMPSGATIPISQTSTAVGVFDVLAALDPKRQTDLRHMLGGLGQGFLGRGPELNTAVAQSPDLAGNLGAIADAVNARPGAAARLVPDVQALTSALDPVRSELAAGWDPAARALAPFTDERSSVQATLREAPAALSQIQQGLAQTDPLLAQTAGLSRSLAALTGPAPAALQSATAMLRQAPGPLVKARTFVSSLAGAVPPTVRLLLTAWPLASPLARALGNEIAPLTQLGRYGCDVAGWARDWSALFALGSPPQTSSGPVGLARAAVSRNSSTLQANTPEAIPVRYYGAPCTAILDKLP